MGERNTLSRSPGSLSGRLVPGRAVAFDGEHVFCLGAEQPGHVGTFAHNDRSQLSSTPIAFVDRTIVSVRFRVIGPPRDYVMPAGWVWRLRIANELAGRLNYDILPGDDFAITISSLMELGGNPSGLYTYRVDLRAVYDVSADPVELMIPTVYVDTVVEDTVEGNVGVYNMLPANGVENVARTTPIRWTTITNTGIAILDAHHELVTVNGVPAIVAGVLQPGWSISRSTPIVGERHYTITPATPFDSDVEIECYARVRIGLNTNEQTWTFRTIDETAPVVHSASSPSHERVRVRFDEPVKMVDASDVDDALNPANYTVEPLVAPAVTVTVVAVEAVSDFEVDVVVDLVLTQGASYQVTVSNVADLLGNVIVPPLNVATFDAYECPVPEGRRFELWRMISDMDRRRDETRDLYKFLSVLQEPLDLLLCDVDRWVEIIDVDLAEERYVDQMLITLGNPFSFDLDLIDKRRLVRSLMRVYQQKGTAVGIINVIRFFLGLEVTIEAYNRDGWILGESELGVDTYLLSSEEFARFAFVVVSPVFLTDEQRARIDQLVDYMKPPHTHHVMTVEPALPGEELTDYWDLGISQLGMDTFLGELAGSFPYTFPFTLA